MIHTEQQVRTAAALVNRAVQPQNIAIRTGLPVIYTEQLDFANKLLDDLLANQQVVEKLYAQDFPTLVGILPGPRQAMPLLKKALEDLRNGGQWSETDTIALATPDRPSIVGAIGASRQTLRQHLDNPRYEEAATTISSVVTLLDGGIAVGTVNLQLLEAALREMQIFAEILRQIAVLDDNVPGWVEAETVSITYGLLEMTLRKAVETGHWPIEGWSILGALSRFAF